jgi:hypothetical protein
MLTDFIRKNLVCIANQINFVPELLKKVTMEIIENTLSPQESLNLIADIVLKTKDNIKEQSFCFLLWGWLISVASILFYIFHEYTSFKFYFLPFPVLAAIGLVATVLFYTKRFKSTETYLNYYLNRMWLVLGAGFISVVFVNVVHQHQPFTYTLIIAAIGTLISGLVIRFNPMIIGGLILLGSALISTFIPSEYLVLLHGAALIAGYLVPGYMLKHSKDNNGTDV